MNVQEQEHILDADESGVQPQEMTVTIVVNSIPSGFHLHVWDKQKLPEAGHIVITHMPLASGPIMMQRAKRLMRAFDLHELLLCLRGGKTLHVDFRA